MIVRMLAQAVLAQTGQLDDPQDDDHDDDESDAEQGDAEGDAHEAHAHGEPIGDASAVAATSLTEACVALRDALAIFHGSLVASAGDTAGHADRRGAKRAARAHRRARTRLSRAQKRLAAVAAAEELAGWVEARLGPETAPIVAGYLRLEHARGRRDVAQAELHAQKAAIAVLRTYSGVSTRFDAPKPERFDRVLSGHLRRCMADASEALDGPADASAFDAHRAAKRTRRLGLLLGLCTTTELSDAVNEDAGKALRVCHQLTRSLQPKVSAAAIETVLGAAGLSALIDASQIAQLAPAPDRESLGARHLDLLSRVERLVSSLESTPTDVEIERKYLLSGLPGVVTSRGTEQHLRQGYLPGERLRERVRSVTSGGKTTYLRTIKLGRGVQRIELEEATTAPVFNALWKLTEGCRVIKRRYAVSEGDLVWEIDAFDDRELFLAEVELDDPHQEPAFPEWLAPYVVREVTNESEYVNLNLAR